MAQFLNIYILAILLFALSFKGTTSTSHPKLQHGLKSLHFVLYQHDTFNKTGYIIANGVAGAPLTQTSAPFGTLYALQNRLTFTSNLSSKVAGSMEGASVTSTFDGFWNIAIYKLNVQLKQHKGSIIIVGDMHFIKPSDIPVVGGTGDFMFVQGYVTTSLVNVKDLVYVYKIEFHLYWPPYIY